MSVSSGSELTTQVDFDYPKLLTYWIKERYLIHLRKQDGKPRPWSEDPIFQSTYFCNVHRENDKVTKYIRKMYSVAHAHPNFEYNIIFSRFINWPDTLGKVGYIFYHSPDNIKEILYALAEQGKIWGGAYIVSTHGQSMSKIDYLVDQVLETVNARNLGSQVRGAGTLEAAYKILKTVDGIGSFLAAQIIADLKNTSNYELNTAPDRYTFVAHGPGSLRGASWFHYGKPENVTPGTFTRHFQTIREYVDQNWPVGTPIICNQDLQNCLCEFDKYCRVLTGTGRSKRGYNGR
jgi:hypothetical protein